MTIRHEGIADDPKPSAAPPRGRGVAIVLGITAVVGLAALIGVRVKDTLATRAALATSGAAPTPASNANAAVELVRGKATTWRPVVPVTGTLAPIQQADIGFKATGRLRSVSVKEGDIVKVGQRLATLDVTEAAAQASAARATVKSSEITLDLAKDGQQRADSLFATKSLSDVDHVNATQRVELAKAELERARAQAELATVMVSNGVLTAPFAGLITRVPSGVGRIVGAGDALFHIEDTSVLKLNATVSEGDVALVETKAAITLEGAGARTGVVTAVLHSLDPQTRRVPIVAEIQNDPGSLLLAGAFVRASLLATREISVLTLPGSALRPGSQDEVVVSRQGKAHLIHIVFVQGESGTLVVRDGLVPSDDVVVHPSSEAREGDDLGPAPARAL